MVINVESGRNRMAEDTGFKDKTVLVTGGTGFMGKVLIEKILRTCPAVKLIYVLIRNKNGNTPQDRLEQLFKGPLFDLLKETRGNEILKKVVAIPGDVSELGLGLSKENIKLLANEIQIVYHLAATIRFDDTLKKAVLINARGTHFTLEFAKKCKQLLVFVHVSTAFSHLHERILYEKTYPPPADPYKIIKLVETLDERIINIMTEKIMGDCPNTYSFTKALAEGIVNDEMDNLPIVITRPSVVIPIWKDPLPGWTDSINGPAGVSIAGGKGILRTMYCKPEAYIDYLPVDVGASSFMLAAYDYINFKKRRVYNITTSCDIKVSYSKFMQVGMKVGTARMPLNWAVWYPGCFLTSSKFLHNIYRIVLHYIPAIILDSLIFLSANKPILWKAHQRIQRGCEVFEFYWNNQWDFNNDARLEARDLMTEYEKAIYPVEQQEFDIEDYLYNCAHAARLYILKESDDSIPTAQRHMKLLYILNCISKSAILFGLIYILLKYFIYPKIV